MADDPVVGLVVMESLSETLCVIDVGFCRVGGVKNIELVSFNLNQNMVTSQI